MLSRHLPLVEASWMPTSLSLGDALVLAGLKEASFAYLYGQHSSGLYVSTDAGTSWQITQDGLPDDICITSILPHADHPLIGTVAHGIFCGDRGGRSWRPVRDGLPRGAVVMVLATAGRVLMAGTRSSGIFRSENGGISWQPCSHGLPFGGQQLPIHSLAMTSTGLVAAHPQGLHRLDLKTYFWEPIASPLPWTATLLGFHVANQGILYGWNGSGVYSSANAGTSWVALALSLWQHRFVRSVTTVAGRLFVSTQDAHGDSVYYLADGGTTWKRFDEGLPRSGGGIHLATAGAYLLAGVGTRGIWRRRIAEEGTAPAFVPPFLLEQNTPNPFQETTRIRFVLHQEVPAVLAVSDVTGTKRFTLFDAVAAAGNHELLFDGSGLPAGFYIYSLEACDMSQSRTMFLLR